jgi:hypothetical protein
MKFRIESTSGVAVADGLDKQADVIRLREGSPEKGQKKPVDLAKGEQTRVEYPLEKRRATYVIMRTE